MSRGARFRRRGTWTPSLCAAVVLVTALGTADAGTTRARVRLIDGSISPPVPAALHPERRALVRTRVRLVRVKRLRALVGACVPGDSIPGAREAVERVGVNGHTITFLGLSAALDGCDRNPRAVPLPWCGRAAWPLQRRRVSDPRLSICNDARGRPFVAFAWINPLSRAAWIVVDQPHFGEVYPVARGLPVRVTTVAGIGRGRARLRYAQYDGKGVLLAKRTIAPAIAG